MAIGGFCSYEHLCSFDAWITDWESLNAHKAFAAPSGYGPFLKRLSPILDGSPHLFHIKLPVPSHESSSSPFNAPVTECISLYFPSSLEETTYNSSFAAFIVEVAKASDSGVTALIGGWGVETYKVAGGEGDNPFFGAFIGRPSVESHMHMEFRKKENFPETVGHLKEGAEETKMQHVVFKRVEAKAFSS